MAKIFKNVDKIITSSGTEVDLENIQASGGDASGLEGSGIAYSTDGTDEFYDAGSSSEVIPLDIDNPQDGDGLIYDAASQTWKNGEIASEFSATGGATFTSTDSNGVNWMYHLFTGTGSNDFTASATGAVEYLLVAGGGGGGCWVGGGGGAGGLLSGSVGIAPTTYPIVIGAGGDGSYNPANYSGMPNATAGGDTTALGLTAIGGGFGVSHSIDYNSSGKNGGSGGGASSTGSYYTYWGSGTSGQGNRGGAGEPDPITAHATGGGGGYGAKGQDATHTKSGDGGIGTDAFDEWLAACGVGHLSGGKRWIAGGGGGGFHNAGHTLGTGGLGGGGNGNYGTSVADHGMANTGGGGGGSGYNGDQISRGGNGGSGLVIIRYTI